MNWIVRRRYRILLGLALGSVLTIAVGLPAVGRYRISAAGENVAAHATHGPRTTLKTDRVVPPRPKTAHRERGPFVDGSDAPQKIPDHIAYSHFLAMLMPIDNSEASRKRQRAYVKHVLQMADAGRTNTLDTPLTESDVKAVLEFVGQFEPTLADMNRRNVRNRDREPFVSGIVASMPARLGKPLADRLHWYVQNQFKRRIKLLLPTTSTNVGTTAQQDGGRYAR